MSERDWLSFYIATNEIEQRLGVSGGVAMRMLRDACASGDVRSRRQPYNPATGIDAERTIEVLQEKISQMQPEEEETEESTSPISTILRLARVSMGLNR